MKAKQKRYWLWGVIGAIILSTVAFVFIPPMLNMNHLKPKIEASINGRILGDIRLSLLGGGIVVANDVEFENGTAQSINVSFSSNEIIVNNAHLKVEKLTPPHISQKIILKNSKIFFLDRDYILPNAVLENGEFKGYIRTSQHRYEVKFQNNEFIITNNAQKLQINGQLQNDGTATGSIDIDTDNANRFFEFDIPKISGNLKMNAKFKWNGRYDFEFYEIIGNALGGDFFGDIKLFEDGSRYINLVANDIKMDLSFLINNADVLKQSDITLSLFGDFKFGDMNFKTISASINGDKDGIKINEIIADDIKLSDGTIGADGAKNLMIKTPGFDCLFSGTAEQYNCIWFTYKDMVGNLEFAAGRIIANLKSDKQMPDDIDFDIFNANRLRVNFEYSDASGIFLKRDGKTKIRYKHVMNKPLSWFDFPFDYMVNFTQIDKTTAKFIATDASFDLTINGENFVFKSDSWQRYFPNLNLQFFNDSSFELSGNKKDIKLNIFDMNFYGYKNGNDISVKTDVFDADKIIKNEWYDDFEVNKFLSNFPLMTLFDLKDITLSLGADTLIYRGVGYDKLMVSFDDNAIGISLAENILATIEKRGFNYDISVLLNGFKTSLDGLPLGVRDSSVSGEIKMRTNGRIASDILDNLNGTIDIVFKDGMFLGLETDGLYNAENKKLGNEKMFAYALNGGESKLGDLRVNAKYKNAQINGEFKLRLGGVDGNGSFDLTNDLLNTNLNLQIREISENPILIDMKILPDNKREYSMSGILNQVY